MTGIAYLHSAYLFPSDHDLLHKSSSSTSRSSKKNPFLTLGHIREPPSFGSAPVNGVDEDGFEIVEESFVDREHEKEHRTGQGSSSRHEEDQQQSQQQNRRQLRIQYDFEISPVHTADAKADQTDGRLIAIKDMIRHAWFGFMLKMETYNNNDIRQQDIKSKTQRIQLRGEWIDVMDTLLMASMTDEYNLAKSKILELFGSRGVAQKQSIPYGDRPLRKQGEKGDVAVEQVQEQEQSQEQEDINDGESNDADTHGIGFFETVVRQLGGLLSIYELERAQGKEDPKILEAAVELGDQLALAFQGPNKALPANTIFSSGRVGFNKVLAGKVSLAEVSTFQLEFRQLSYLSSNDKYKDLAEKNIKYLASLNPRVPGLYPAYFDPKDGAASEYVASFGSLSDGFYEYLLKTYLLTGDAKFKDLYISSIEAMHKHLISHSQKTSAPHLVLGVYDTVTDTLVPKMDHLNSATGLGADEIAFLRPEFSKGEEFEMLPHGSGFYVIDPEFALRPETVESLFILYRTTGDSKYQEYAWKIAQAIEKHCRTKDGYSGLINVMDASEGMTDTMPSHFMSQTLKYLYLIFDDPEVTSLDDYIFNTEGHLFKYPIS
ncbi:mannosyl-oligosaccharide alpha-1,2-mannosidase [Mortierella sp. AD032]|nr:mannosyl-oligosaccharide alpha-1,2-mannosidase [Mortierella sp. AD032]